MRKFAPNACSTPFTMSSEAPAQAACTVCKKPQSELANPLKRCAKCHTKSYCSRDCQKADWPRHKRECTSAAASRPIASGGGSRGSAVNPPKDEILENANQTVAYLKALSHCPEFNPDLRSMPSSASGLMYMGDFVGRTFREFWPPLLPPAKFAEMASDLESFSGQKKEDQLAAYAKKFEEIKSNDPTFDKDAWPEFQLEKYQDAIQRNMMAASLTQDSRRMAMFGGGSYNFPQEVKDVCSQIMNS